MPAITTVATVRLPTKLLRWAQERAKTNGQSFTSFIRVTLEQLKHGEEQAKRIEKIKGLEGA